MKCSIVREYSRDSFDRFGDDLCELILSYFPLSDCLRLQCVSKQFNAKIFNKQTKLVIIHDKFGYNYRNSVIKELITNDSDSDDRLTSASVSSPAIDNQLLNYVLTKCANINDITIDTYSFTIKEEVINTISNTGIQLKQLRFMANFDNNLRESLRTVLNGTATKRNLPF